MFGLLSTFTGALGGPDITPALGGPDTAPGSFRSVGGLGVENETIQVSPGAAAGFDPQPDPPGSQPGPPTVEVSPTP
jgi:hypothetical protein